MERIAQQLIVLAETLLSKMPPRNIDNDDLEAAAMDFMEELISNELDIFLVTDSMKIDDFEMPYPGGREEPPGYGFASVDWKWHFEVPTIPLLVVVKDFLKSKSAREFLGTGIKPVYILKNRQLKNTFIQAISRRIDKVWAGVKNRVGGDLDGYLDGDELLVNVQPKVSGNKLTFSLSLHNPKAIENFEEELNKKAFEEFSNPRYH